MEGLLSLQEQVLFLLRGRENFTYWTPQTSKGLGIKESLRLEQILRAGRAGAAARSLGSQRPRLCGLRWAPVEAEPRRRSGVTCH